MVVGNWLTVLLLLDLLQLFSSLTLLGLLEALRAQEVSVVSAEELMAVVTEHSVVVVL